MNGELSQEHRPDVMNSGEPLSPQRGSVNLFEDPDSQLGLRGSSFSKPRTVAELMQRWSELPDDVRERAVHELGVGRPRACVDQYDQPRFPTAEDVGIPRDPDTHKLLAFPDDPTLRDRDLDVAMLDKTPEEIVELLKARDEGMDSLDGYLGDTIENLMTKDIEPSGGGGSKNRKGKKPAPTSIIDRTAAYASEKSVRR